MDSMNSMNGPSFREIQVKNFYLIFHYHASLDETREQQPKQKHLINVTHTATVYYMREQDPTNGAFHIKREDVKQLGIFITTTGIGLLVNAKDTLTASQLLAASRSHDYGSSGPVDVVQLLPESDGLPWLPEDDFEEICDSYGWTEENGTRPPNLNLGLDMWIDDEGRILEKHFNPFASLLAKQDIYGDVIIWGCFQGDTVCVPYEAYEKLKTAAWMTDDESNKTFIQEHPLFPWWTVEEARTVVDSLETTGRVEMTPNLVTEMPMEKAMELFKEQARANNAALMFATVGFESQEYRDLMKEADAL